MQGEKRRLEAEQVLAQAPKKARLGPADKQIAAIEAPPGGQADGLRIDMGAAAGPAYKMEILAPAADGLVDVRREQQGPDLAKSTIKKTRRRKGGQVAVLAGAEAGTPGLGPVFGASLKRKLEDLQDFSDGHQVKNICLFQSKTRPCLINILELLLRRKSTWRQGQLF